MLFSSLTLCNISLSLSHTIGSNNILHPSPAPHFETFKVFPMCLSTGTLRCFAPITAIHSFISSLMPCLLVKSVCLFWMLLLACSYSVTRFFAFCNKTGMSLAVFVLVLLQKLIGPPFSILFMFNNVSFLYKFRNTSPPPSALSPTTAVCIFLHDSISVPLK